MTFYMNVIQPFFHFECFLILVLVPCSLCLVPCALFLVSYALCLVPCALSLALKQFYEIFAAQCRDL